MKHHTESRITRVYNTGDPSRAFSPNVGRNLQKLQRVYSLGHRKQPEQLTLNLWPNWGLDTVFYGGFGKGKAQNVRNRDGGQNLP